jgi:hypothetical protein
VSTSIPYIREIRDARLHEKECVKIFSEIETGDQGDKRLLLIKASM